jgi:hypothetical protein
MESCHSRNLDGHSLELTLSLLLSVPHARDVSEKEMLYLCSKERTNTPWTSDLARQ